MIPFQKKFKKFKKASTEIAVLKEKQEKIFQKYRNGSVTSSIENFNEDFNKSMLLAWHIGDIQAKIHYYDELLLQVNNLTG